MPSNSQNGLKLTAKELTMLNNVLSTTISNRDARPNSMQFLQLFPESKRKRWEDVANSLISKLSGYYTKMGQAYVSTKMEDDTIAFLVASNLAMIGSPMRILNSFVDSGYAEMRVGWAFLIMRVEESFNLKYPIRLDEWSYIISTDNKPL